MSWMLTFAIVAFASMPASALAALPQSQDEQPLRYNEPLEAVVSDLEAYVQERMAEDGIPGLSIALVRDFQVVWTAGFGVKNRFTGGSVTPATAFEVASISKVVTAYAALRLVDQGRLSLNAPVASFLEEPWLPPSELGNQITLRHLASHSSGLTDQLLPVNKSVTFRPGSRFLYSGGGALYMQEAVEQTSDLRLCKAGRDLVFEPLGMASSSFVNDANILPRMANGHLNYAVPLLAFLTPFGMFFLVLVLLSLPARRILAGVWRPDARVMLGIAVVTWLVTLLVIALTVWKALPNVAVLNAIVGTIFLVILLILASVGHRFIAGKPATKPGTMAGIAANIAWVLICVFGLTLIARGIHGPIPRGPSPPPSAVGSLRATAPDLATFLIELARPQHLSPELAAEIRRPQIRINEDFSWGLGPGIQHSAQGDALWQMGIIFGSRSVMLIYPEHGLGAVVLTNSERGFPAAYDIAERALRGKAQYKNF